MNKFVVSALLAAGLATSLVSTETTVSAKERKAIQLGTNVALQCKNPGSSQDVSKTPSLVNTTGVTIPKGQRLFWEATGGDHGDVQLTADLLPNASVIAHGGAGNGYQCTAHFARMPDVIPGAYTWQGTSSLRVDMKNLDPWVTADASVLRVEVMSCAGQVLQSYDSVPVPLAQGATRAVIFPATFVPGKAYLRITADATKKVLERSETNNVMDGAGSCVH